MKHLIYILPFILLSCSKESFEPVVQYQSVDLESFMLQQFPNMDDPYFWDGNSYGPDLYVVIKNQEGAVFHVTSSASNIS
ncbi:MAG: hypothetical protein HKN32_03485, partial [Flavobacteriales bacterium]|nr:hypothetical protein [Flavobacteriales bacterium]